MTSIKDVATHAGVSVATVSYYLNDKRISAKNAEKIQKSIEELNYIVNDRGRSLRAKQNLTGIIMPNIEEPYFVKIIHGIKSFLQYNSIPYSLEFTDYNVEKEKAIIKELIGKNVNGIVLYSCQPKGDGLVELMTSNSTPFVLIENKPDFCECNFIGTRNDILSYNIIKRLLNENTTKFMLFCGPTGFRENKLAVEGYVSALKDLGISDFYSVIPVIPSREAGFKSMIEYLDNNEVLPQIILTTKYIIAEGIRYAMQIHGIDIEKDVRIITIGDSVEDVFYSDSTITKTSRNAFKIGEEAARLLLKNVRTPLVFPYEQITISDPINRLFMNNKFYPMKTDVERSLNGKIKVLLIDDNYSVNALQSLLVDFEDREQIKVELVKVPPELQYSYIMEKSKDPSWDVDVILLDIPWLEEFVDREIILPLTDFIKGHEKDFTHFIPNALEQYGIIDDILYAIPYMCCAQLLFYRKDLFNNELLKRQFEDKYKIPLSVPKNWAHFKSICEFFTRKFNKESPTKYGTDIDFAYAEEIMGYFYPRLWANDGFLVDKKGVPHFNSFAARNAIKNLYECLRFAHPDSCLQRPKDTVDALVSGEAAIIITYYYFATELSDYRNAQIKDKIGWAQIPGEKPILSGWSLAITKNSSNKEKAFSFIKWASCQERSIAQSILGGQSPSEYAYQNYDIISIYPWLSEGINALSKSKKREVPRTLHSRGISEKLIEDVFSEKLSDLIRKSFKTEIELNAVIEDILTQSESEIFKK